MFRRTREQREAEEDERLAPSATRALGSKGRERHEPEDRFRTAFQRDRDRILHSKAFRRLKHKTQVFINPEGDHFVTRLTHTMQVAQVGRAIANALGLNEPLTEAICLGHDLGHSPFGHTGEVALSPYMGPGKEWQHAIQSVRIVRELEPLNLTWEVRDGIRASSWKNDPPPATPEGRVCRFADRIAYLAHDAEDAARAGLLRVEDLPGDVVAVFGPPKAWIDRMVVAVVEASAAAGEVTMAPDDLGAMQRLRDFMFERIYLRPEAREQHDKAIKVIRDLVDHFAAHAEDVPDTYRLADSSEVQAAVDYVAGMSDSFAMRTHDRLFRPQGLY
ncbi:MAG: HD domain-containing protein [Actinobacteria bacterium]|nr:HD domain-containing protein [Actinomycetota bacterium]